MEILHSLTLRLGNTLPTDGDSNDAQFLEAWKELHAFFSKPRPLSFSDESSNRYYFTIDASDAISLMNVSLNLQIDEKAFDERMSARSSIGARSLSCDIFLNVRCVGKSIEIINVKRAIYRFLQQLFVTMNIACPGSLSMSFSSFLENDLEIDIPNLNANLIEFSYQTAIKDNWPTVSTCLVADTWNWLHKQHFHDIDLAETPATKAAFAILILGVMEDFEESYILAVARAYEALLADGRENIQMLLKQRLTLILGEPLINKKWFATFYNLRSEIAHGRRVLRPAAIKYSEGQTMDTVMYTYHIAAERAIAVLIAILQDLVQNKSKEYYFTQKFKRIKN